MILSKLLKQTCNIPISVRSETSGREHLWTFFQQRGLRKILHIPPTYIDRTHTNEDVLRIANEQKGWTEDSDIVKIIPITQVISARKVKLLGHVIRAGVRDPTDPLFQVTFDNIALQPKAAA